MPEISVIVPVYRVESYLHRCVDSILNQTFPDFELILVDDGSPDSCGAICDEYAAKDHRIHVIHQENRGLSAARNAGIDWAFANSDSQWLTFVDSDDWILPEMLERLWNAAKEGNVSISICGFQETTEAKEEMQPDLLEPVLWTTDAFYVQHNYNATVAVGKLYRKDCFEALRYPLGKIHEDEYVTYQALFQYAQIMAIPAQLYVYFINPCGITKGGWSPRRLDAWDAYEGQYVFFRNAGKVDLAKNRLYALLWSIQDQITVMRNQDHPRQYDPYIRQGKQKIRFVLTEARQMGFSDVLSEYRKSKLETLKILPFVWKERLEKRWRIRK